MTNHPDVVSEPISALCNTVSMRALAFDQDNANPCPWARRPEYGPPSVGHISPSLTHRRLCCNTFNLESTVPRILDHEARQFAFGLGWISSHLRTLQCHDGVTGLACRLYGVCWVALWASARVATCKQAAGTHSCYSVVSEEPYTGCHKRQPRPANSTVVCAEEMGLNEDLGLVIIFEGGPKSRKTRASDQFASRRYICNIRSSRKVLMHEKLVISAHSSSNIVTSGWVLVLWVLCPRRLSRRGAKETQSALKSTQTSSFASKASL
jgi:hypothetical protein